MTGRATTSMSDADLVANLRSRDDAAYEELLRRYEARVYSLARSVTRNETDAQDVLQDTFLSVFRKIDLFKERSSLSTWIYRIAMNTALMKIRKRKQDERMIPLDEYMPKYDETGHRVASMPDWPARGDEVLERKELAAYLRESIGRLEPGYRTVFILRDQEGLSTEEVASILDLSVPAVKSRLHRARLFLRERIKRYWLGAAG